MITGISFSVTSRIISHWVPNPRIFSSIFFSARFQVYFIHFFFIAAASSHNILTPESQQNPGSNHFSVFKLFSSNMF